MKIPSEVFGEGMGEVEGDDGIIYRLMIKKDLWQNK